MITDCVVVKQHCGYQTGSFKSITPPKVIVYIAVPASWLFISKYLSYFPHRAKAWNTTHLGYNIYISLYIFIFWYKIKSCLFDCFSVGALLRLYNLIFDFIWGWTDSSLMVISLSALLQNWSRGTRGQIHKLFTRVTKCIRVHE